MKHYTSIIFGIGAGGVTSPSLCHVAGADAQESGYACPFPLQALIYVPGTCLIDDRLPDEFVGDVWEALSSGSELTWGDTTHTMTYMRRFYLEMEDVLEGVDEPELVEWLAWLKEQADTYPDLLVGLQS